MDMTVTADITVEKYNRLKSKGLTHKDVAERLFVSPATLSRWKRQNGITDFRCASDYTELRKKGYRDFQIQLRWNISGSALYQWKRAHDIPQEYFKPRSRNSF